MKKVFFLLLSAGLLNVSYSGIKAQTASLLKMELVNKLAEARKDQMVELPAKLVAAKLGSPFVIKDANGRELPYQWIYEGQAKPVKLILLADFAANETKNISFENGTPSVVKPRTYARYVPERYEDFAWENDKIAFRMYGKALEKNPRENASGLDVWAKRTPDMVINKWYKTGDYHKDHGEGLDFFNVGMTLGAGDALPFLGDTLNYLGNYAGHETLDSGALRSSFKLVYPAVTKGNYTISAAKIITLDAGSQVNKEEVSYTFTGGKTLPVFAGIVHWNGKGEKYLDAAEGIAIYWEPPHGNTGTIGTAVYFPQKNISLKDTAKHLGAQAYLKSGESWTYYNGAAWDKAGEIKNADDWKKYVENYKTKLSSPIIVKVIK